MKRPILIAAPSNLGLKAFTEAEPGVKYLPQALMDSGFMEKAGISEFVEVPPPPYGRKIDPVSKVRNADQIAAYSRLLADETARQLSNDRIPIVLGGDCSILIGNMLGLKQAGRYALFFMDGHTDYGLPRHSSTAGAAGMDLAIVTGNGHDKLCNIEGMKPYVPEPQVFSFGNRDYDPVYVDLIKNSQIHYYDLDTVRRTGIAAITGRFLDMVRSSQLNGFWVHLDVDVLDDDIMPCVDSREKGGLSYEELEATLRTLLLSPYFTGMEITILDPTLDTEHTVVPAFTAQMGRLLQLLQKG